MSQDFGPVGGYPAQPSNGDPGTLDLPWYGIGLVDAVKRFFQKYARFDGRASRSEYWWLQLAAMLLAFAFLILIFALGLASVSPDDLETDMPVGMVVGFILFFLFSLATLVPSLAITVRRLHDANFSGWFILLSLIPIVGSLALFIMLLLDSNPQGQRFDR